MPFVTLVSLVLVAGVAGLLFFNTSMQQASFAATALENRARVLDAHEQSLQMELAELRDPQRVAQRAQEQGMVAPDRPAFIRLSDGKVLGSPTPATLADDMRVTADAGAQAAQPAAPPDRDRGPAEGRHDDGRPLRTTARPPRPTVPRPVQVTPPSRTVSRGVSVDPAEPPPTGAATRRAGATAGVPWRARCEGPRCSGCGSASC